MLRHFGFPQDMTAPEGRAPIDTKHVYSDRTIAPTMSSRGGYRGTSLTRKRPPLSTYVGS